MKLVTAPLGKNWLRSCLTECEKECSRVRAAVPYADHSDMSFFHSCLNNDIPLDFYGRYDATLPIDPRILRWFFERGTLNMRCHLVPDFLHAKVIWWVDAGAYIGSANLTDRAWNKNFEAGCFMTQEELVNSGMEEQLTSFFESLDNHAQPLIEEIVIEQEDWAKHLREIQKLRHSKEIDFEKIRFLKRGKNPTTEGNDKAEKRNFTKFEDEWNNCLNIMRHIATRVSSEEYRPHWIPKDVPSGAQADQFLHAYYFQIVRQGVRFPIEKLFRQNENRREQALLDVLKWWRNADYPYDQELEMLTEWAVEIRNTFSQENLKSLTEEKWVSAGSKIHAIRDYAGKHSSDDLGSTIGQLNLTQKAQEHCRILWKRQSVEGHSIKELLEYVIWSKGSIAEKLWNGHRSDKWHIHGIGLSTLGEVVGWSRPSEFPPRNKRTSKGLRALGHPVTLY